MQLGDGIWLNVSLIVLAIVARTLLIVALKGLGKQQLIVITDRIGNFIDGQLSMAKEVASIFHASGHQQGLGLSLIHISEPTRQVR